MIPTRSERLLRRARWLARLLDDAFTIPIIRKRVGLDPLLGMVPWLGDLVTFVMALYIVWVAYQLNAPRSVMLRMLLNVALDHMLNIIPVAGEALDFVWKANRENMRLLEAAVLEHGLADRPYDAARDAAASMTIDIEAAAKS